MNKLVIVFILLFLSFSMGYGQGDNNPDPNVNLALDDGATITGNAEIRRTMSGTYTATTTGTVELEIHMWSSSGKPNCTTTSLDNIRVHPETWTFEALNREVVASEGGSFRFQVDVGSDYANKMFIILQSLSGCPPGSYRSASLGNCHMKPFVRTTASSTAPTVSKYIAMPSTRGRRCCLSMTSSPPVAPPRRR